MQDASNSREGPKSASRSRVTETILQLGPLSVFLSVALKPTIDALYESRFQLIRQFHEDSWFFPFASIPILYALAFGAHLLKLAPAMLAGSYDNTMPREESAMETAFVKRCKGCHYNTLEAMIGYAPAVILCKLNGVDPLRVRELCLQYMGLRVAYAILYVCGVRFSISVARTAVFGLSMGIILLLYVLALVAPKV